MITVEEAKSLLFSRVKLSKVVRIGVAQAYGNILAEDIYSPIDLPIFDASSVDGYAVNQLGIKNYELGIKNFKAREPNYELEPNHKSQITDHNFQIIGEIKAGDAAEFELKPGEAVRIFTGAMVPESATEVVMQEQVEKQGDKITINGLYKKGNYIRKQASQLKRGGLVIEKGSFLHPGVIGFLASMGVAEVPVYKKPSVSVIVTGNEIVKPGTGLNPGQIYESNSYALAAALAQQHINPVHVLKADDTREELDKQLALAIEDSDIVMLTGGISVGEYDLVYNALKDAGAETLFYKVAQRPGKPLWVGYLGEKWIFALPGNPASVMACFYEYVYPALRRMRGFPDWDLHHVKMKLLKEIKDTDARAAFIRAKTEDEGVMPLEKQDSGMMVSFSGGNALIYVPKETTYLAAGEMVEVHLLPFEA